jgi:hypothetical protein
VTRSTGRGRGGRRPGAGRRPDAGWYAEALAAVRFGDQRMMDRAAALRATADANATPAFQPDATDNEPRSMPASPARIEAKPLHDIVEDGRALILRLLSELEASTTHIGELHQLIEDETAEDRDNRRRDAMLQAVSLSSRARIMKNLASAAKALAETGPGKREEKAEAAKRAARGTFAVPAGPRLVRWRSDDG